MKKTAGKSKSDWEAVCARCGRCCHEKIEFEGRVYYTDIPCQFLDPATSLCRVYGERDRKRPGCVRLTSENVSKGFLPQDCPYVAAIDNYPAPTLLGDAGSEES